MQEIIAVEITTPPIFFEQTDYEIIVKSTTGGKVSFWNENYAIRNRIGTVIDPTKLSYKEDYQLMINDISEMACQAVIDFMRKTYQMFSFGENHSTALAVYFQILSTSFQNFMNAVNRIISAPHHKLATEHVVVFIRT